MSVEDLTVNGWRAFWSQAAGPGMASLLLMILIVAVLLGFATRRMTGAVRLACRIIAGVLAVLVMLGFLGVLGVTSGWLVPFLNNVLELIQAPLYIPEG